MSDWKEVPLDDNEWTEVPLEVSEPTQDHKALSAIEGFGEGASLGYLNNLQAITEKPAFAIMNALTGQDVEADDYLKARDYYNNRQEQLKESNPGSFTAGQLAGSIASSIPVAKAAQGATALARIGNAAKAGAIFGGLQNTNENEGKYTTLDRELANRTENAGFGLGMGALAQGAGEGFKQLPKVFSSGAEKLAEKATGATGKQTEKFSKGVGRYLLDNKIVSFGDDAERIAQKANFKIGQAENVLDDSLKALDAKGATVSQDAIVKKLQEKASLLSKDPSQADVVKKLNTMIDDIINTGESNISLSSAENIKRGFNKTARNWLDPEKGQAGKTAYLGYRDAVEESAGKIDPEILNQFKNAKKDYGMLNPIAEAAEKRAAQLNQSPFGGLLDGVMTGAGGAAVGGPVGIATGVAAAGARRVLAPRLASSMAVTSDKIANYLLKSQNYAQMAKVNPQAFSSMVTNLTNRYNSEFNKQNKENDYYENDNRLTNEPYIDKRTAQDRFVEEN